LYFENISQLNVSRQQLGLPARLLQPLLPDQVSRFQTHASRDCKDPRITRIAEAAQPQTEKKQIYTHESQWNLYAINFSNRPEKNFRLSLGSFVEDTANKVEIIRLDEEKGDFEHCAYFEHEYPPSKIMWIPDTVSAGRHGRGRKGRRRTSWRRVEST
jgi:hypothetical protein